MLNTALQNDLLGESPVKKNCPERCDTTENIGGETQQVFYKRLGVKTSLRAPTYIEQCACYLEEKCVFLTTVAGGMAHLLRHKLLPS